MDTQKMNYPSFFKIMMGDFSTRLGVPFAFEENFKNMNLRRNFTISLKFFVEEALSWKVKMEKNSDGLYDFTQGWSKIVKDLHLAEGDFLVFYLVADYDFQLAVYDQTSRLKNLNINPTTNSEGSHSVVKEDDSDINEVKKTHSVAYTESLSKRPFCILPERFGKDIHKECNEDDDVSIKDENGRVWVMNLKLRIRPSYRRYELLSGWKNFCEGNNLVVGDKLEFKHVKGSTIEVVVRHK